LSNTLQRLYDSARVDRTFQVGVSGIVNSDILKFYVGLLVQGKNDLDSPKKFRSDRLFLRSFGAGRMSSTSTFCRFMDTYAASWAELAEYFSGALLQAKYVCGSVYFEPLPRRFIAAYWYTAVTINSITQKGSVGRTYELVGG
jgi:hypothetical protein